MRETDYILFYEIDSSDSLHCVEYAKCTKRGATTPEPVKVADGGQFPLAPMKHFKPILHYFAAPMVPPSIKAWLLLC